MGTGRAVIEGGSAKIAGRSLAVAAGDDDRHAGRSVSKQHRALATLFAPAIDSLASCHQREVCRCWENHWGSDAAYRLPKPFSPIRILPFLTEEDGGEAGEMLARSSGRQQQYIFTPSSCLKI